MKLKMMHLLLLPALYLAALLLIKLTSPRPDTLGHQNGQLSPCPDSPNCVNSQAEPGDDVHSIDAIPFSGSEVEFRDNLQLLCRQIPGFKLITAEGPYLHYECTTRLMRYTDDLEFYFDEGAQVIHLRSASRLGYSDLGANRKRVEHLRSLLETAR